MWSRGSLCHHKPPAIGDEIWEAMGNSKTLAVKGESVLLIMPSRFIIFFPFMAFLTSSNSFLMFFIIWTLPWVDYAVCLEVSLLLFLGLWVLSSLSLRLRSDYNVFVPFEHTLCFKSSFCFFNSCTLAISVWICWAITMGFNDVVVVESIGFKEISQYWIQWLIDW